MERNIENLFNAVVEQAADDYRVVLCKTRGRSTEELSKDLKEELEELENFFAGDIRCFTKLDGETLAEAIRKEVIECNYDLNAIRNKHRSLK